MKSECKKFGFAVLRRILFGMHVSLVASAWVSAADAVRPNIVLVMADDQGWGETGYYRHPVLQTPNLDAMALAGLRFDRFYAGAPVCSPTRASVLTGRSNHRTGVESHGFALRLQEKTVAQALQQSGYRTAHFGKWHLNGLRGPGVPILAADNHHPGIFGFDTWLSVTNFFDRNPILSREGNFEEFSGDSSEIVVDEALKFMEQQASQGVPFFTVIWFGTPHSPFMASEEDRQAFRQLDTASQHHYGELVAMDRSLGTLRQKLRQLGIHENTLVWFCSDNGGLPNISPTTVDGLRGFKGSLYEGGLRVPSVVEWPSAITQSRVTKFPAVTMDIFPTISEIVGLPSDSCLQPQDGISLRALFDRELASREQPLPFFCFGETALIDNDWKLLRVGKNARTLKYELYNLASDPAESQNRIDAEPAVAAALKQQMKAWEQSLQASIAGRDYPQGEVNPGEPQPRFWTDVDGYRPYFEQWKDRPEYKSRLKKLTSGQ